MWSYGERYNSCQFLSSLTSMVNVPLSLSGQTWTHCRNFVNAYPDARQIASCDSCCTSVEAALLSEKRNLTKV